MHLLHYLSYIEDVYIRCSTSFIYWQELFLENIFSIYSQNTILPLPFHIVLIHVENIYNFTVFS